MATLASKITNERTYIVSAWYDNMFFIFMPLFAFLVALTVPHWAYDKSNFLGIIELPNYMIAFVFLEMTGAIGFLRAYLNPVIIKRFWFRLIVIPILFFCSLYISVWIVVFAIALEVFWDIYHSTMQTFGISKFYDKKHGNDTKIGRKQDILLNYVIYTGPILWGIGLIEHSEEAFTFFEFTSTPELMKIPLYIEKFSPYIAATVISLSIIIIYNYYTTFSRLIKNGEYKICSSKMILLATTAFCCISIWSMGDFLMAYLAINIFHSGQYFALVWHTEQKNLSRVLHVDKFKYWKPVVFLFFCGAAFIIGTTFCSAELVLNKAVDASILEGHTGVIIRLWIVIGLLHYWHDGFIWSHEKINRIKTAK